MSKQEQSYLIFQCYGHEGIFYECAFALLTLSQLYSAAELKNIHVVIYTDKPEWFSRFKDCGIPLMFRKIDDALIKQWRGEIDFVHRVKIEVLRDFMQRKPGNILYLDTDIVFLKRIDLMLEDIQAGDLYMHVMEGIVSDEGNPILKKLAFYLREQKTIQLPGKALYDSAMWNAGVLGFGAQHNALLDDVLFFTDMVYPNFPKHVVEQFAFSVYFQRTAAVRAAAPYILHYWNVKEMRAILESFFEYFANKKWDELVMYSTLIQVHVLMQEKISFLHNRSLMGKLKKTNWAPALPNWELLAKQLE